MNIFHDVKCHNLSMLALLLWVMLPCCQNKGKSNTAPTNKQGAIADDQHGHEHLDHGHDQATDPSVKSASLDQKLGKPLAGVQLVTVDDLIENPDKWQGKAIRLEGAVTDMCFHRRAWYGIANQNGNKVVRVITGKSGFLVPEGAIGSQSIAEGQVEVITIKKEDLAHYKKTHKFISDKDLQSEGPIRQPILIATGAQFKR